MKTTFPVIGFVVLLTCTLGTGWLQGSLTNRWGTPRGANRAADSLPQVSLSGAGNWRVRHETPLSDDALKILQCPAHIGRVYEHQQTGDLVTLMVIIGPPGPVSVHTPDICYVGRDYAVDGDRRKVSIKNAESADHTFWDLPLKNNVDGVPLRVLYGWSTGTQWEAATYPRIGYGGFSHLYKLQMSVITSPASKATGFDPAENFLESFLPQLQPYLVEASR
jgi:Protein of unknown function (DUF3485)